MMFSKKETGPDISEMSEEEKREHREELLTGLIESYSDKEDEWAEKNNPFRDKTNAEKAIRSLTMLGIRAAVGGAAIGATVMFGGVPLIIAAGAVGGGLAASYLGRFGVDVARRVGGAEAKENETKRELGQLFTEKEKKLASLARRCREAEAGLVDEGGNKILPEQARLDFIEYVLEISNPESEENRSYNEKKRRLISSQKKWAWIKAGTAIAAGVIAGGTIAELMRSALEHAIKEAGIEMSGHGLGKVAEYSAELKSNAHVVREITHGDHSDLVFQYNDGEVQAMREVVHSNPTEFAGQFDSTAHATELANMGYHDTGAELANSFQSEVSYIVSEQSAGMTLTALSAVAISEEIDGLSYSKSYKGNEEIREDTVMKEEASLHGPADYRSDALDSFTSRIYTEAAAGIPNMPRLGSEVAAQSNFSFEYNYDENNQPIAPFRYDLNVGTICKFVDLQDDGSFILEPVSDKLNQRRDRGRFVVTKEDFIKFFHPAVTDNEVVEQDASKDEGEEATAEEPKKQEEVKFDFADSLNPGVVWRLTKDSKVKINTSDHQEAYLLTGRDYELRGVSKEGEGNINATIRVKGRGAQAEIKLPLHYILTHMMPDRYADLRGDELIKGQTELQKWAEERAKTIEGEEPKTESAFDIIGEVEDSKQRKITLKPGQKWRIRSKNGEMIDTEIVNAETVDGRNITITFSSDNKLDPVTYGIDRIKKIFKLSECLE